MLLRYFSFSFILFQTWDNRNRKGNGTWWQIFDVIVAQMNDHTAFGGYEHSERCLHRAASKLSGEDLFKDQMHDSVRARLYLVARCCTRDSGTDLTLTRHIPVCHYWNTIPHCQEGSEGSSGSCSLKPDPWQRTWESGNTGKSSSLILICHKSSPEFFSGYTTIFHFSRLAMKLCCNQQSSPVLFVWIFSPKL